MTEWNETLQEELKRRRQGDVIEFDRVLIATPEDDLSFRIDANLAVVLTQSCDLVRAPVNEKDPRPYAVIAPLQVVRSNHYKEVAAGYRPAYASVPWAGDNYVANLEIVQTIRKIDLVRMKVVARPGKDEEVRGFAYAVARKFGRAALPDEVQECLRPLRAHLRKRHGKNSPEGRILADLQTIRVEPNPDWTSDEIELAVIFVVEGLPLANSATPTNTKLITDLKGIADTTSRMAQIAAELDQKSQGESTLRKLWDLYACSAVELCDLINPVIRIQGEAVSPGEFGYDRYRLSDDLDLDYLSVEDET